MGGVLVSRPGMRTFHGASFPAPVKGHAWHVAQDGTRTMLVAAGTGLYRLIEGGDPVLLSMANLPADIQTRVEPEVVNFLSLSGGTNTTFIYDGVNPTLKYDDSGLLTKMGITTPPTPHSASSILTHGFVPKGTRNIVQTLKSLHHESSPSETPREVTLNTLAGNTYTVASPVQGVDFDDPQVKTWCVYSTIAGGGDFRFAAEADIGVDIVLGASSTDDDKNLAERTKVEFLVNDPPPAAAVAMAEHRGQLAAVFADDLNLVRFSNLDPDFMVPEGWPETFVQPVMHSDGDEITALASLDEWLVVWKMTGTYAIVGESFDVYRVVPVIAAAGGKRLGVGVFNPGTVLQVENAVFFCARDGMYKVDRYATPSGGISATRLSSAIDALYSAAKFSLGASTFFDRIKRIFAFLGHG